MNTLLKSIRCVAFVALLTATAIARAQEPDFTNKTIDELIVLLDDDSFTNRKAASLELEVRVAGNLPVTDMAKIVGAAHDGSSEVRARAGKVVERFLKANSPKAEAALDLLKTSKTGKEKKENDRWVSEFQFDGGKGKVATLDPVEFKYYTQLHGNFAAFRNHLKIGDTVGAAKRLDEMKDFVMGLNALQFTYLNLKKNDGSDMTQQNILDLITAAKVLTEMAKAEIENKVGAVPEFERFRIAVAAGAPIDMGKTVNLSFQNVLTPGLLDYSWVEEYVYAPPPDGYVAFGPSYDLIADPSLRVDGVVNLSIQIGEDESFAYGITDPSKLGIVRVANAAYEFLDVTYSPGSYTLMGFYTPSVSPLETDQLGEFMLVVPMPEATGDFNLDGVVDGADYTVWVDTNRTRTDYVLWQSNFGTTVPPMSSVNSERANVPEPSSLALTLIALLAGLRRPVAK